MPPRPSTPKIVEEALASLGKARPIDVRAYYKRTHGEEMSQKASTVRTTMRRMVEECRLVEIEEEFGYYRLPTDEERAACERKRERAQRRAQDSATGKTPGAESKRGDSQYSPEASTIEDEDLVPIYHVTVSVDAGPGAEVEFEEVDGETWLPAWYVWQTFGVSPDRVKRVRVHGTSMRPTIEPGELVYVVMMERGQQPMDGGVYVLRGPHGILIKRLFFDAEVYDPGGDGEAAEAVRYYVRIHSDNPEAGTDRIPEVVFRRDYTPLACLRKTEKSL